MAQDHLWVNGAQLLDFNNEDGIVGTADDGLHVCSLPTAHDYNGTPAQYSENAQYNENGKLLFFVVDGNIYDYAGYKMADNDANPATSYPLPEYLIDNITASWDTRTYRASLENDMAFYHGEMTQALDMDMSVWQTDTLYNQVDSVRAVWRRLLTPAARYAEALTYMEQANFDSAQAVITRLPNEYKLSYPESIEQTHMLGLIAFLQGIYASGRTETDLDSGEVAQLQALVNTGVDRATEWGQNLLCFGYGICRAPLSGGEGGTQKSLGVHDASTASAAPALNIYPNPANSYATFAYDLKATPDHAYLAIRDVSGRELDRIQLIRTQGQSLWDTREVSPGSYTIELVNAGGRVESSVLVVKP